MLRRMRIAVMSAGILVFIFTTVGCSGQVGSPERTSAQRPPAQSSQPPYRAIIADALDDTAVPGISLDSALTIVGEGFSLPTEDAAGAPVKVVVDDMNRDEGQQPGLLILYDTGVKLKIRPGYIDMDSESKRYSANGASNSRPFTIENVAGRRSIVNRGDDQSTETGTVYQGTRLVTWNQGGMVYTVSAANESVPLGKLVAVARAIK